MRIVIIRNMTIERDLGEDTSTTMNVSATDEARTHHFTSRELFHGARAIIIDHEGRQYQLRITQNGKLILTA